MRPVGGDHEVPFDVRVVAATNRDLEEMVESGRFRQDLFYRIHVVRIELPPLKARGNDVLLLAQRALERAARAAGKRVVGLSAAAVQKLVAYNCPGNVRELQNAIESAVALTHYQELTVDDLVTAQRLQCPPRVRMRGNADMVRRLDVLARRALAPAGP